MKKQHQQYHELHQYIHEYVIINGLFELDDEDAYSDKEVEKIKALLEPSQLNDPVKLYLKDVITSYSIHYTKLYEKWICGKTISREYLIQSRRLCVFW